MHFIPLFTELMESSRDLSQTKITVVHLADQQAIAVIFFLMQYLVLLRITKN